MVRRVNIDSIDSVEFGVCLKHGKDVEHRLVPVDGGVKNALKEMLQTTYEQWEGVGPSAETYDPAQQHGSKERLTLSLDSQFVSNEIKALYSAHNMTGDASVLRDIKSIYYYFVVFKTSPDGRGRRHTLLSIRGSTSFRGLASHKNALVSWLDDSLKIVQEPVFKFDLYFDFYVDGNNLLILRPKAFEAIACVDDVVLQKAAENVTLLGNTLSFLELSGVTDRVSTHKRTARILASLVARNDLNKISEALLKKHCKASGIELKRVNGKLVPEEGKEEALLRVLDRRRYTVTLIKDQPEIYDAASRKPAE